MQSPLDILTAADKQPTQPRLYVDEANFAKLCEHPAARRIILDGFPCVDLDGLTYRHVDALDAETPADCSGPL